MKKLFGVLQKVGKALMLPVAILPAAGILLAFGNALQNPALIDKIPALDTAAIHMIASVMENSGNIVFANLPLLFAVGVAVGLAGGDGVAGLAAIIGYLIMNVTMGTIGKITPDMIGADNPSYASVLGIPTLQTGVFGGILIGVIASYLYKKFYNIELPAYLGFFAGKRFVPIVTAFSALILGIVMFYAWGPIQHGLNSFSKNMIDANLTLSAFIFGVIERSLIPFGLHHIFYSPFWYEFGQYTDSAGHLVRGDQAIFMAQLKDGVDLTAGTFTTGKYPFMMFGLPAAALAIYHTAKPEKKKYVAGIMGSAALTSFLTGITEPLEFSFLFVAPVLFGIHAIFAGLSFMVMQILGVKIGMTFSGGVIDYLLFGVLPNRTEWWLVIPVGLVFSLIYYFGFRFAITKFNLKTPGREDETEENTATSTVTAGELPQNILIALGNKENLVSLDACITRLRVEVKDKANVNKDELKRLGAAGVLEVGNNVQAIFGPKSDILRGQIQDIIEGKQPVIKEEVQPVVKKEAKKVETDNTPISFVSPLQGRIMPLDEVPDQVFAQKMMGDGFAIEPTRGLVTSPIDGKVVNMFPTKHALGLVADNGTEVLIHFGLDTVKLDGLGFKSLVAVGDTVKQGDKLLEVNLSYVKDNAPSVITPIIFTAGHEIKINKEDNVSMGEENIITIK